MSTDISEGSICSEVDPFAVGITDCFDQVFQANPPIDPIVSPISFKIISGGTDYTTPAIVLTSGGGSGATATARVSQGIIIEVKLTAAGVGYTRAPNLVLKDPSPRAQGAIIQVLFNGEPNPPTQTYPCPYNDGFIFDTQAELDAHLLNAHNQEPPEPEPTEENTTLILIAGVGIFIILAALALTIKKGKRS